MLSILFIITLFLYGIGAVSILFVILFTTSITLFLYGIGALFLPQETYLLTITLFLYGIGANLMVLCFLFCSLLHYSYMELELFLLFSIFKFHSYYIIPIWNWSWYFAVLKPWVIIKLHYSYMELEHFSFTYFCFYCW